MLSLCLLEMDLTACAIVSIRDSFGLKMGLLIPGSIPKVNQISCDIVYLMSMITLFTVPDEHDNIVPLVLQYFIWYKVLQIKHLFNSMLL